MEGRFPTAVGHRIESIKTEHQHQRVHKELIVGAEVGVGSFQTELREEARIHGAQSRVGIACAENGIDLVGEHGGIQHHLQGQGDRIGAEHVQQIVFG